MNLRRVTELMCEKIPSLSVGLMICDSCRKQLYKVPYPSTQVGLQVSECDSTDSTEIEYDLPESLELSSINQCLEGIGETPIVSKNSLSKNILSISFKRSVLL